MAIPVRPSIRTLGPFQLVGYALGARVVDLCLHTPVEICRGPTIFVTGRCLQNLDECVGLIHWLTGSGLAALKREFSPRR
jgi:hypothetical protein